MFLFSTNMCRLVAISRCCRIPVRLSKKCFHAESNIYKHEKSPLDKLLSSSKPINGGLNTQFVYVSSNTSWTVQAKRYYSKKKSSKRNVEEEEEESDSEEEYEAYESKDFLDLGDNIIRKNVPSMRIDTVIKASLGISKKQVEKIFYANKIRVNGEPVIKKALFVSIGDEIDVIKGFSPENSKFILVDRIVPKGVGKVNASGTYPLTMEVLKSLTSENYEKPWNPSNMGDTED